MVKIILRLSQRADKFVESNDINCFELLFSTFLKGFAMSLLDKNEIQKKIETLKGWEYLDKQIIKEFKLNDFKEALAFVNKVGDAAEAMDHHPNILMHSWNKVKITISTHSEGGVTNKDFQLAEKIESLN